MSETPPNILFLMTDQHRADALGLWGSVFVCFHRLRAPSQGGHSRKRLTHLSRSLTLQISIRLFICAKGPDDFISSHEAVASSTHQRIPKHERLDPHGYAGALPRP